MMSHDSGRRQSVGRISDGLEECTLSEQTLAFVYQRLPEWRDDPDRAYEESEWKLNPQLCKFLNARARADFPMVSFNPEEFQTGQRKVDLSATLVEATTIRAEGYTVYEPFLVLECKRLPAPSPDRRMEYVTGGEKRTGGIQRFKLGLHGAELSVAAMIGYVQKESVSHWHQAINGWISDLAARDISDVCPWQVNEQLGPMRQDAAAGISACESVHDRSDDVARGSIRLHHLWVRMAAKQET